MVKDMELSVEYAIDWSTDSEIKCLLLWFCTLFIAFRDKSDEVGFLINYLNLKSFQRQKWEWKVRLCLGFGGKGNRGFGGWKI